MDPAWIALIGTLCGGIGLKVVENWLGRGKAKKEENREVRRDLNAEVTELVARVEKLEDELMMWREKFFAEQEKVALLRLQVIRLGGIPADRLTININDEDPIIDV